MQRTLKQITCRRRCRNKTGAGNSLFVGLNNISRRRRSAIAGAGLGVYVRKVFQRRNHFGSFLWNLIHSCLNGI